MPKLSLFEKLTIARAYNQKLSEELEESNALIRAANDYINQVLSASPKELKELKRDHEVKLLNIKISNLENTISQLKKHYENK